MITNRKKKVLVFTFIILFFGIVWLTFACQPAFFSLSQFRAGEPSITPTSTIVVKTKTPTQTPEPSSTPTPTSTPTLTSTPTATSTPFSFDSFDTKILLGDVDPHTYIAEPCDYLANRWGSGKSEPGTIVVPVMYHSIRQAGKPVTDSLTVSHEYFEETMNHAKELGFETITSQELADFLYSNAPIPKLSMILIVDDRRPGVIRDHFLPILEQNDWTVTLAYISGVANEQEWEELRELNSSNRLDMQAHGYLHNGSTYFTEFTPLEVIESEIYNPISAIEENFGVRPIAFIWPGGNYTKESLQIVHEAEYKIGFTANARGPLMFNWIPLGQQEAAMNDPLMLLPRYWSSSAYINLDDALTISKQSQLFAEENRETELKWYTSFCQGYPQIPSANEEGENTNGQ